jgi:hypothetical protein
MHPSWTSDTPLSLWCGGRRCDAQQAEGQALASILRVDAHLHRRMPADTELCQAIAVLARAHQDAIWRRTKAHNELRSMLRVFFPIFLAAFATRFALGIASPGGACSPGDRSCTLCCGEALGDPDCGSCAACRA